jgi:hypothetical protein
VKSYKRASADFKTETKQMIKYAKYGLPVYLLPHISHVNELVNMIKELHPSSMDGSPEFIEAREKGAFMNSILK